MPGDAREVWERVRKEMGELAGSLESGVPSPGRLSQNALACPTTACFNGLPAGGGQWLPLGRKVAYFGDGHQFKDVSRPRSGLRTP